MICDRCGAEGATPFALDLTERVPGDARLRLVACSFGNLCLPHAAEMEMSIGLAFKSKETTNGNVQSVRRGKDDRAGDNQDADSGDADRVRGDGRNLPDVRLSGI